MVRPFAGQEIGAVELLQAVPHPPQLCPDRPSLGLAGMGREDEFNRQPVERLLHVGGAQAERFQLGDASGEGFANRLRRTLPFPLAEHPDPLPVLGDVDEVKIDAEGPGDGLRLGGVE